jgi:hypothetical protein
MKLQQSRIEFITREILTMLESEGFIEVYDRSETFSAIQSVIMEDLMLEDRLDEEVRELLETYAEKMDQDRIQYHEMFKMVKDKLAKERNLIL